MSVGSLSDPTLTIKQLLCMHDNYGVSGYFDRMKRGVTPTEAEPYAKWAEPFEVTEQQVPV